MRGLELTKTIDIIETYDDTISLSQQACYQVI